MKTSNNNKDFFAIDIFKFIASLLVVCIHIPPFTMGILSYSLIVSKLAVPFFAISSSFFFFRKSPTKNDLIKFITRIILLLLFWTFFLLPFILNFRDYSANKLNISQIIHDIFFVNFLPGSWFFTSLIYTVLIIYFLKNRMGKEKILALSVAVSIYFTFSKYNLIPNPYNVFFTIWDKHVGNYMMGIPFIIVYIAIGYVLSQYKINITRKKTAILFFINFLLMLISSKYLLPFSDLFLIPTTGFLFILGLKIKLRHSPFYKKLRNMSVIIFCTHVIIAFEFIGRNSMNNFFLCLTTITIAIIISEIIFRLQKHKYLNWLKYSY